MTTRNVVRLRPMRRSSTPGLTDLSPNEFAVLPPILGAIHNFGQSRGEKTTPPPASIQTPSEESQGRKIRLIMTERGNKEGKGGNGESTPALSRYQRRTNLMKNPDFSSFLASQPGSTSLIYFLRVHFTHPPNPPNPTPALVNSSRGRAQPQLPCSIDQSLRRRIHSPRPLARWLGSCDFPPSLPVNSDLP